MTGSQPSTETLAVPLTPDELDLLCAALDSHIYWELTDETNRDSGYAGSPGTDDETTAEIEAAESLLRRLEERRRAINDAPP
jgi:hypothetical protein